MRVLEGRKTFIGIILVGLAYLGWSSYIFPEELTELVNHLLATGGIIMAVYGRVVATKTYL